MADTRVYILARELGVKSSAIVKRCQDAGLDVQNHMAPISSELAAIIRVFLTEGKNSTRVEESPQKQLGECKDCLYFLPKQERREGLCRKYPPRVVVVPGTSESVTCWPVVERGEGCGEFESAHA